MIKKTKCIFAIVLALVMTIGMTMLPVGAVSEDDTYLEVDFSGGATEITTSAGEYLDAEAKGEGIVYDTDSTLNRTVAVFNGLGSLKLPKAMLDMNAESYFDYSFEILVNVAAATSDEYIFGNLGGQSGTGMAFSGGSMVFWAHDGSDYQMVGSGVPAAANRYDQWVHLVGTYDDTAREISLYVNGELVDTVSMSGPANHWQGESGTTAHLILGANCDYSGGDDFNAVEALIGKVAYFRIYSITASAEDVAELYEASGISGLESVPSQSTSPTGGGNTTTSPSSGSNATPVPTKAPNQPNTNTFDLGIVSFAAVALSSAVVVKRRKR